MLAVTYLASALAALPTSAAPSWTPPAGLSAARGVSEAPQIAIDSQGNATVIWRRLEGHRFVIESVMRRAGHGWSEPVRIAADVGTSDESPPQLAVDARGNVTAAWEGLDGENSVIQSATRPAKGSWSAPVTLSRRGRFNYGQRLAVDPEGNAIVVWVVVGGSDVKAATRPFGGSWSAPVTLRSTRQGMFVLGQDAFDPQVAVDPQGNATAIWAAGNEEEGGYAVQSSTRPAGGDWSASVNISAAGESAVRPQLAIDLQGTATAVWPTDVIQSATRPAGGAWSAPVSIFRPGRYADEPQVGVDPRGNLTAVWKRLYGGELVIQGATRLARGRWSAPMVLSADDEGRGGEHPQVAVDSAGNATVVWEGYYQDGRRHIIQSATRSVGGRWSAPFNLSNGPGPGGDRGILRGGPQVAVGPRGNAIAVWEGYGRRSSIIYAATSVSGRAHAARVVRIKGRRALVKLWCGRGARCGGIVRLTAGRRPIAEKRFGIAKSRAKVIRLNLNRRGRGLFAKPRRHRLQASLTGRGVKNRGVLLSSRNANL